jgi:hypothetical protein
MEIVRSSQCLKTLELHPSRESQDIPHVQPLNLQVFESLKRHYRNLRTNVISPKPEGKLLRALHTWYNDNARHKGVAYHARQLAAIDAK